MELELEILEVKSHRKGIPTISLSNKNGLITLSSVAVKQIRLNKDSSISLARDPKSPDDWYLIKYLPGAVPKEANRVRVSKHSSAYLNCSSYTKLFFEQFKAKIKDPSATVKMPIATAPVKLKGSSAEVYAILTKGLK